MTQVRFRQGEAVRWPAAPRQIAQVIELRRTCVRIFYLSRRGRPRQPIVRAEDLAALQRGQMPLPLFNYFGRAWMRGQSKTFAASAAGKDHDGTA